MTNNKTQNESPISTILIFTGLKRFALYINQILDEIINYAKEDFKKFSTITAATITIAIWIIRAFGFSYLLGVFSIYNIDKSYIHLNDNLFLQLLHSISIFVIIFISNYFFLLITTYRNNIFKRVLYTFSFVVLEYVLLFIFVIVISMYDLRDFMLELSSYPTNYIILTLLLPLLTVFILNFYGIMLTYYYYKDKCNTKDSAASPDTVTPLTNKSFKKIALILVVFLLILLFFSFVYGELSESNRSNFKIIQQSVDDETLECNIFKSEDNDKSYQLYAIVYENEQVYVTCPLYKENGHIFLNKDQHNILPKNNTRTFKFNNIYNSKEISDTLHLE